MMNEELNEELKAKLETITDMEDAYKLACEDGFKGTYDDFAALVTQAADEIAASMSMNDMEQVAGGNVFGDAWDSVSNGVGKAWNWVKENPTLTTEIVGGVVTVGAIVGFTAYKLNAGRNTNIAERTSTASSASSFSEDFGNYVDKVGEDGNWTRIYDNGYSMPLKMD